ncbi:MAG: aldolase citrate lyase family [Lasallia pustulata]|uniref:Aldolase citrate lyase family n=1 Tax=Lasallia pustulata TaxID=136370 RepID=A0A5M8PX32_9LECA|nr:MAG: aldolase citrate lyase family [Lasallia pustulata]
MLTAVGVSIAGHDHAAIGHALDAGASIVLPQVDTVEQAKHIVSAAKFGRRGTRSAPPFRLLPGLTDMPFDPSQSIHGNLNDQAAIIIQIESLEGINNLDAILTECPEIDAVFLGMLDCRVSMGMGSGSMMGEEPEWLEAVATYEAALDKHDKPRSGIVYGPAMRHLHKEKSLMFVSADAFALMGMVGELAEARSIFPKLESKKVKVSENEETA